MIEMKTVLCLTDTLDDVKNFIRGAQLLFFPIEQLDPDEHRFEAFQEIYHKLSESCDLASVDLIIAEFVEAIPLVYFMRKEGFYAPAIFIPHTNAYPLNLLFYFLLVSHFSHPDDLVLCGSKQAAIGYEQITRIKALPITTFGIKSDYEKGDKKKARKQLGLSPESKYLLYTGRFMNDKGIESLLDIYERVRSHLPETTLLLSITHIDPAYFNHLASRLKETIIFYRLEKEQMVDLYRSADLFISVATSIFETYGKSPLEAIACGTPALLPRWDGFPYYINKNNGALVDVLYGGPQPDAPYSFATINQEDCIAKCLYLLSQKEKGSVGQLPSWAFYDMTMKTLTKVVEQFLSKKRNYFKPSDSEEVILFDRYPPIIEKICSFYSMETWDQMEKQSDRLGLTNREDPGDLDLLKELHDHLFQAMDTQNASIVTSCC